MSNGHENAFPPALKREELFEITNGYGISHGLTKRELFAAMAMQGLWSNSQTFGPMLQQNPKAVANWSVEAADALLEELNRAR